MSVFFPREEEEITCLGTVKLQLKGSDGGE
jgi:hypothetical protein